MYYTNLKLKRVLKTTEAAFIYTDSLTDRLFFDEELLGFWKLIYAIKGGIKILFPGGRAQYTGEGQLMLIPPEQESGIAAAGTEAHTFCIAFKCGCRRLCDIAGPHGSSDEQKLYLSHILNNVKQILNRKRHGSQDKAPSFSGNAFGAHQSVKGYLELLLLDMINNPLPPGKNAAAPRTASADRLMYEKICEYLGQNLSVNLTVEDICKSFSISSSAVKKLFALYSGGGVIKFFHRLKIERAKEYIIDNVLNFTEISEALGFSSLHYFSRYFKLVTGMSPTEFAAAAK